MTLRRLAVLFVVGAFVAWLAVTLFSPSVDAHTPLRCRGHFTTMTGTEGDDTMAGTPQRDIIRSLRGDDTIFGFSGNDLICSGAGDDEIFGGDGDDHVRGGRGDDECTDSEHTRSCRRL